ncbi:MAG: hypothetical protein NVS3B26_16630 [Mycobacteriales bacterium]
MALLVPLFLQANTGDPTISYAASDFRQLISALAPLAGTILVGDLQVAPRGAGANMSVDVASGRAVIPGTLVAGQGSYIVNNTSTYNVAIAAADPTNPRIDLIVAQVNDKQADAGTAYNFTLVAVTGTAAASPVAPNTPNDAYALAQVAVAANTASIVAANITDTRTLSGVGQIPKWDFSGGSTMVVPNVTDTRYTGYAVNTIVGMSTAGMFSGEVQVVTPGRYIVHFSLRLPASTNPGSRLLYLYQFASDGSTIKRRLTGGVPSSALTTPLLAAGTFGCVAGDRLAGVVTQNTGQSLTVDDTSVEANFAGAWIGA